MLERDLDRISKEKINGPVFRSLEMHDAAAQSLNASITLPRIY